MRLLHTRTLELEQFVGEDKPPYAILSHTWGEDEVLFEDIFPSRADKPWANKLGAAKVQGAAELAAKEGYNYIWIDTCCIAKSSSAELSEAINSMFQWYSKSTICYAYLSDVSINPNKDRNNLKDYDGRWFSQWFCRTWTLQELIAPEHVQFFDMDWNSLGSRRTLADLLCTITRIDHELFQTRQTSDITDLLDKYSVHSKMSWASHRKSTRPEDKAYSLMGLFNVNMPLLYGEGGQKAFQRLQEEIVKDSNDRSMLLHRGQSWPLASSPADFSTSGVFRKSHSEADFPLEVTKTGLSVSLLLYPDHSDPSVPAVYGIIESLFGDDPSQLSRPAVLFDRIGENEYRRRYRMEIYRVQYGFGGKGAITTSAGNFVETNITHDKLERKTIKLRRSVSLQTLGSSNLSPYMTNPRLSLQPIVNSAPAYHFEYDHCWPANRANLIVLDNLPIDAISEVKLAATISLRSTKCGGTSALILIVRESGPLGQPFVFPMDISELGRYPSLALKYPAWIYDFVVPRLPIFKDGDRNVSVGDAMLRWRNEQSAPNSSSAILPNGFRIIATIEQNVFLESPVYHLNIHVTR